MKTLTLLLAAFASIALASPAAVPGKPAPAFTLVDAEGNVVKKGSALGEEAKAFATAKKMREKLAKG